MTDIDTMNTADLPEPETVRTPGKTWTEFPESLPEPGDGTVQVDAPDAVEVVQAVPGDLPDWAAPHHFAGVPADTDRVTAAHAAALESVICIRVPRGTAAGGVTVTATGTSGHFPHHVVVVAEDGAAARIVVRAAGDAALSTGLVEAAIGNDAVLDIGLVNTLSRDSTGYTAGHATVAEDGTARWEVCSVGGGLARNRATTHLDGPRSTLDYRLGFLSADDQHMDMASHVIHGADNTRCDMDSRGVAMDRSRAVYTGVQEVTQDSEGTRSFQDETTLLIGSEAEADTTPQLQIDNNDVEATHAATTGHIDETDLFYMRSRGLSDSAAKREIITGMFDDLLRSAAARDAVHDRIAATLGTR